MSTMTDVYASVPPQYLTAVIIVRTGRISGSMMKFQWTDSS